MDMGAIKRAPRWAWYAAAGVGGGVILLKFWKGRAVDPADATTDATTVDQGGVATTAPSPVITPPVIISGGDSGDNGALADLVSAFTGTFASSLDNAVNTIGGLAQGDQALAGTAIGIVGNQSQGIMDLSGTMAQLLANAGSAPAPMQTNPTPIVINIPAAGAVAAPPATAATPAKPPNPEYPYYQEVGTRAGHWYKIVLKNGGRYKWYDNGDKIAA